MATAIVLLGVCETYAFATEIAGGARQAKVMPASRLTALTSTKLDSRANHAIEHSRRRATAAIDNCGFRTQTALIGEVGLVLLLRRRRRRSNGSPFEAASAAAWLAPSVRSSQAFSWRAADRLHRHRSRCWTPSSPTYGLVSSPDRARRVSIVVAIGDVDLNAGDSRRLRYVPRRNAWPSSAARLARGIDTKSIA